MADSDVLRQRRRKAHVSGDHSLCRRCPSVNPGAPAAVPVLPAGEVRDAPLEMRRLAARLAAAHEADPANGIVARELRMTLQALMPVARADDGLGGLAEALREA